MRRPPNTPGSWALPAWQRQEGIGSCQRRTSPCLIPTARAACHTPAIVLSTLPSMPCKRHDCATMTFCKHSQEHKSDSSMPVRADKMTRTCLPYLHGKDAARSVARKWLHAQNARKQHETKPSCCLQYVTRINHPICREAMFGCLSAFWPSQISVPALHFLP